LSNERSEFLMTTLPIADTAAIPGSPSVVLPHFAAGGGWSTELVLVNPTDTAIAGAVEFRAPGTGATAGSLLAVSVNGRVGSNFQYSIPSHGISRMDVTSTGSTINIGSVKITGDGGLLPSGLAIFSNVTRGMIVSEASVPLEKETS